MSNPQNQKPWKAEYAKSGRSSCRSCKSPIASENLRLGKMVQSTKFDGLMPMWNHADCILKKAKQIKSVDDVENIELLRWEDQQKIRKYIESGGSGTPKSSGGTGTPKLSAVKNIEYGIEVSQTSRATCKHCGQKIIKGEVRISTKPDGQGARGLAWHHAKCLMEQSPSIEVDKLSGWDSLSSSDQSAVSDLVMKGHSMDKGGGSGTNVEAKEVEEATQQSSSKGGTKRGKNADGEQKSKAAKVKGDVFVSRAAAINNGDDSGEACNIENRLEAQSKELWALKDDLKKHVTTAELREMLEANDQDSTGSELDLCDRWLVHCFLTSLCEFLNNYLAELSLLDYECIKFLPSVVAASVIFLARFIIKPEVHPWTSSLYQCSGYSSIELKECVLILHDLYLSRRAAFFHAVRDKYKQHKFKFVANLPSPPEVPKNYFEED